MPFKKLIALFLTTSLMSFPQEVIAEGGKGKQIEDPFERAVYWQRKIQLYRDNHVYKDLPKAGKFKLKLISLMKNTLSLQKIDDIQSASLLAFVQGEKKVARAKRTFCQIYKEYQNEIDNPQNYPILDLLIQESTPLGTFVPLFSQSPLCNYFTSFLDIRTMANWERTSKSTHEKLVKLREWKKIKIAQIFHVDNMLLLERLQARTFLVEAYIAYYSGRGDLVYENLEKACALKDPEACHKKHDFLVSRYELGGYKDDLQTPENFFEDMLKAGQLWAVKMKIEKSREDDLEANQWLKKYTEKGCSWAYQIRSERIKWDSAGKQEKRLMILSGYKKLHFWAREKLFGCLLSGAKDCDIEEDRKEAHQLLEDDIFHGHMWALEKKCTALFSGYYGFSSNPTAAHELLDLFVEKGNVWAFQKQYEMHMSYSNGDKVKAAQLLEKGVILRHPWAIKQKFKNFLSQTSSSLEQIKEMHELIERWAKEGNPWALNIWYWGWVAARYKYEHNSTKANELLREWHFLPKFQENTKTPLDW